MLPTCKTVQFSSIHWLILSSLCSCGGYLNKTKPDVVRWRDELNASEKAISAT